MTDEHQLRTEFLFEEIKVYIHGKRNYTTCNWVVMIFLLHQKGYGELMHYSPALWISKSSLIYPSGLSLECARSCIIQNLLALAALAMVRQMSASFVINSLVVFSCPFHQSSCCVSNIQMILSIYIFSIFTFIFNLRSCFDASR